MNGIDFLEHSGASASEPFRLRRAGQLVSFPDPREQNYQWVLMVLSTRFVPGTPEDLLDWQRELVFVRWCAAWDMPQFESARRLAYLVDRYRPALTSDLVTFAAGQDLAQLWRERRWQKLLDLIDCLPGHSWFSTAVSKDKDHARMLAEAIQARRQAEGEDGEPKKAEGPPMNTWTPEVAELRTLADAVRRVEHAIFAVQMGKKAGEPPAPLPRPTSALEDALRVADHYSRKAAHEALVARVLPQKAAVKP